MAKKKPGTKSITNRRARFDYELGDSLVVGVELTGGEAKNLRLGHGHLRGSYVSVKNNELYLINATIVGTGSIPIDVDEQTRARKLLAKKREIDALIAGKDQGKTIVPLDLLTGGKYVKLRIAIGRGKKQYDKRASLKARDDDRRVAAAIKNYR
jgi:SsrA-binding protein